MRDLGKRAWLFMAIVVVFIFSRVLLVTDHFTHYDDLFAPYVIKVLQSYDQVKFLEQLNRYGLADIPILGPLVVLMAKTEWGLSLLKFLLSPLAIAKSSTFAPLQFYLTSLTMDVTRSYGFSLLSIRLPSLFFSILSLGVWIRYALSFDGVNRQSLLLFGTSVLTASWMFLIYSSQAENFSAAVFCVLVIYALHDQLKGISLSVKTSVNLGVSLTILCLLSYQTFFFLPGFFLAYLVSMRQNLGKGIIVISIAGTITAIGTAAIYMLFLRYRLELNPGVHWNVGSNQEFLFSSGSWGPGWFERLYYLISFFLENIWISLYGILGFTESFGAISRLYVFLMAFLIVSGLIYSWKNESLRSILALTLTTSVVWLILVINQKLTLSPTRHSLVLVVPSILFGSLGLAMVTEVAGKVFTRALAVVPLFFASLVLFGFLTGFNSIKDARQDPLLTTDIPDLLLRYDISHIASFGMTLNLEFQPEVISRYKSHFIDEFPHPIIYTKQDRTVRVIMLLCANAELCGNLDAHSRAIEYIVGRPIKIENVRVLESRFLSTDTTNCFSNFAGAGKRGLDLKVLEILD